jgi:hypothetical protein
VDLTATAAPLADVLDRLARQTGMKVVYEGPAPRQLVTLSLHGRTPAETVLAVFEGLGINYALVADATGARVQTLMVAGSAPASSSSSPNPGAGRSPAVVNPRRPFGPPGASPEGAEAAFGEGEEEPEAEERTSPACPRRGGPEPGPANAPQQPGTVPPGAGPIPTQPAMPFSASPFTPQPQPFPPQPPGVPVAPTGTGSPTPEPGTPPNPPPQ